MSTRYFYGQHAEQFSFYRMPKVLFTNETYKGLSVDAKILYRFLLDHMNLSAKNEWKYDLIERKRLGIGKPYLIYVKNFIVDNYVERQFCNCH